MATDGEYQLQGIVIVEDGFRATIPGGLPSQLDPLLTLTALNWSINSSRRRVPPEDPPSGGRSPGSCRAIRRVKSGGDITRCVPPLRQRVFSFSATWPVAMHCTRWLAGVGRVM